MFLELLGINTVTVAELNAARAAAMAWSLDGFPTNDKEHVRELLDHALWIEELEKRGMVGIVRLSYEVWLRLTKWRGMTARRHKKVFYKLTTGARLVNERRF